MAVVVFLRGMNLGDRRITNDGLISVFTGAGHDDVSAYQASGNVILGPVSEGHEVHRIDTELYWLPPAGLNELGQLHKAMDRALGQTTVRTLGTIEPIVEHLANLEKVPSSRFTFTAVPPKIAGAGTFTVRAFASVSS